MEVEGVASPEPLIDVDPVSPAPGADVQKPNAEPASDADAPKTEETPEQQEQRKESRRASQRARARERHAAELASAQTEARLLRERLEKIETQAPAGEPQRDQFEDYESYLRAVTRYDAEQVTEKRLKSEREAGQKQAEHGKATEAQAKATQAWVEREKAFEATTPDYQEVVSSYLDDVKDDFGALSREARAFIADAGAAVLYQLAASTEIQDRIATLSPYRQVAELGKLEGKPPVKKASDAPAPIRHVSQGRSASNGYNDNMSDTEYREWRKGQGARWAR